MPARRSHLSAGNECTTPGASRWSRVDARARRPWPRGWASCARSHPGKEPGSPQERPGSSELVLLLHLEHSCTTGQGRQEGRDWVAVAGQGYRSVAVLVRPGLLKTAVILRCSHQQRTLVSVLHRIQVELVQHSVDAVTELQATGQYEGGWERGRLAAAIAHTWRWRDRQFAASQATGYQKACG